MTPVLSLKPPEVLAPAGGRAQFFAALNAGADAVFLGLKAFNARSRAENFTIADLRELVPLAHSYGMKVLVTVNVLVKEAELPILAETLAELEAVEVDAIIVQDLAVAHMVHHYFPRLRLHASTQMAVHNHAGVRAAYQFGFKRVVLARELTALEIKKIRAKTEDTGVELEAFCHGSLCYSYSGLCFFSGAEDARSGNRGECAYTCRQPYKIINEPGHGFLFSMRDLDTAASLDVLVNSGIDTLKIEGRKKDAQYVASTVRLYRQRLDEVFSRPTLRSNAPSSAVKLRHEDDLKTIAHDLSLSFQRRTTSFFLNGRYHENVIDLDNPTHTGILLGCIAAVRGRWFTLTTACDLERFDGLRINSPERVYHSLPQDGARLAGDAGAMRARYDNKRLEFSLRDLRVRGQRAFAAQQNDTVEIELPDGALAPNVGDLVYKIRSADLKRRVDGLAQPPSDAKLKAWQLLDIVQVEVSEQDGQLHIEAQAMKYGEIAARASLSVPAVRSSGGADLEHDLGTLLSVFGDIDARTNAYQFSGDSAWFVPRSQLKELKSRLAHDLASGLDAIVGRRKTRAIATMKSGASPISSIAEGETLYAVKADRLETLDWVLEVAGELGMHVLPLEELVFEPKRAFLVDLDPEDLARRLTALERQSGVALRLAMPTVIRAWDEPLLKRWFVAAAEQGLRRYEIGNIGAMRLLDDWGLLGADTDLASDFTLYALNSVATTFWRKKGIGRLCLSVEDDRQNLAAHMARLAPEVRANMQAIIFKDTPLFIAEACSLTALHNGCPTAKVCGYRTLEIENPAGERFFVAHESCKSIVYGQDSYALTHKQNELLRMGIKHFRIDFLTRAYDRSGIMRVLAAAASRGVLGGTHTANFDRELL